MIKEKSKLRNILKSLTWGTFVTAIIAIGLGIVAILITLPFYFKKPELFGIYAIIVSIIYFSQDYYKNEL